jgi:hypothetical protein|tara:strand:- start:244 stop:510 length:267 start_codon:yes stop_codon:yes gene_type:complete
MIDEHTNDDGTRSNSRLSRDYSNMEESVSVINNIISGSMMSDSTTEEKKERVTRNIEHLEVMLAKTDWKNEIMTSMHKAVTDGKAYVG